MVIIYISILLLDSNQIGDEGAKALAPALKELKSLTALNLRNDLFSILLLDYNKIGDEGAKALAPALKELKSFTSLDLSNNLYLNIIVRQ